VAAQAIGHGTHVRWRTRWRSDESEPWWHELQGTAHGRGRGRGGGLMNLSRGDRARHARQEKQWRRRSTRRSSPPPARTLADVVAQPLAHLHALCLHWLWQLQQQHVPRVLREDALAHHLCPWLPMHHVQPIGTTEDDARHVFDGMFQRG
jgi:hypothetical protein